MTKEDKLDLAYHESCRSRIPDGWSLYGSTRGVGCSAIPPNSGRAVEITESLLSEFDRLKRQRNALSDIISAQIEQASHG